MPGKNVPVTGEKITAKDISAADLDRLKSAAKADWVKADANWKKWVPVK